ncbi:hypothetical protein [Chitinophaga eiseniae]|uniref:hypothetical protein n=1 Tax=Chitinophaga eiseniae TaxID=634771 RepID=UPI0011775493|nr:hypothetical protein [Chitinophaga eiseniae]
MDLLRKAPHLRMVNVLPVWLRSRCSVTHRGGYPIAVLVRFATPDADGPTGKYFSNDREGAESPW